MPRRLLAALAVAGLAAVAAAGLVLANRSGDAPGAASQWRPLLVGLCRAAGQAEAGDTAGAETSFEDVHEPLHRLIRDAGPEAGGPVLRDKFRVEDAFRGAEPPASEELAMRLRALVREVGRAGAAAGDDPATCP